MGCETIKTPGGGTAIACSRGRRVKRCHHCPQAAPFLCDWKVGEGKTCDMQICKSHAQEVSPDKHLCPDHQAAYKEWQARRAAKAAT